MVAMLSVNGQLMPAHEPCLRADDRGFTLADGIFETLRVHHGRPLLIERHLQRLHRGAQVLKIEPPPQQSLRHEIMRLLDATQLSEAVIRLTVSRGSGQRGLAPTSHVPPTVVVAAQAFQPYPARWYQEGVRGVVTSVVRNELSPLATIKSLSYTEAVLARIEAQQLSVDVGLLRNTQQQIVSADCANLFAVFGKRLVTASLAAGAMPGTVRATLCELAAACGFELIEAGLTHRELGQADEVVLTNVLMEVAPLVQLDSQAIGRGEPGPAAARLRSTFRQAVGLD